MQLMMKKHGIQDPFTFTGMERVAARIGDGGLDVGFYLSNTDSLHARANRLFSQSLAQVNRRVLEANDVDCIMDGTPDVEELGIPFEEIPEQMSATVGTEYGEFFGAMHLVSNAGESPEVYYYHGDHLGSASWITDASGAAVQHLQYLPFGERFVDQRTSGYSERFTFTGKERDEETGYGYFGARYMDHELMTMWLSVDPMADKYPSISPYAYCAWNPVKLVDPDGNDWYRSEDGRNYCWRKGDDAEFEKGGQTFHNIGTTYDHEVGNMTIHYNQNDAEYIYYSTSAVFIPQSSRNGCRDAAYDMAQSTGAHPTRNGEVFMVNHNSDGVATTPTNNVQQGLSVLNSNIEKGLAVVIGIDYKMKQKHNLDKAQVDAKGISQTSSYGDGMTDHFITVVGEMYNCKTGATSYYFYDPGSPANGSSPANVIQMSNGYLQGRTAFGNPAHNFKVTTIRRNIP